MSGPGFSAAVIVLSADERAELVHRSAGPESRRTDRARIILACADDPGASNAAVARELEVSPKSVAKWRRRFAALRLAGLDDDLPIGRPKAELVLDEAERARLTLRARQAKTAQFLAVRARIVLACAEGGRTNKQVAADLGLDESTVDRWRARFVERRLDGLRDDPFFVEKVIDVVGLCHNPPEKAVVLCVDEKSQVQALDRSQPVLPMMPGMPERRTHDYARHGVTSLFAAFNIADGTVIGELHRRRRHQEYLKFLKKIDKSVPSGLDVHIVCDNYATHKTPEVQEWLARRPRFHVHFTPAGSSWINQAERWFGLLTDQMIRRAVHKSVQALEADIRKWTDTWNENPRPFTWTKTADEILHSLAEYLTKISSGQPENRQD